MNWIMASLVSVFRLRLRRAASICSCITPGEAPCFTLCTGTRSLYFARMISSNITRLLALFALVFWGGLCAVCAETAFDSDCVRFAASRDPVSVRLTKLFKLDWDHTMRESPAFVTGAG